MNTAALATFLLSILPYNSVPHQWTIIAEAPAKHHFNLQAPLKASITPKSTGKEIKLSPESKTDHKITYLVKDQNIDASDEVKVEAYLCDDKKTYCVKKAVTAAMSSSAQPTLQIPENKKIESLPKKESGKKDQHGFYDNSQDAAFAEAKKSNKPLLIDFYGIWCPPCNLFNEVVFPKAAFKKAAKDFVLLKMDADLESSWELKSRFNIRGYPTLVFANPDLSEISRVVGYMNLNSLVARMAEVKSGKNISLTERVAKTKGTPQHADALKKAINDAWESEDFAAVKTFTEEGLKSFTSDLDFKIFELKLACKEKDNRCSKDSPLIEKANTNLKTLGTQALIDLVEIESNSKLKNQALSGIDELRTRINPKTLQLDGFEATAADLDSLVMDVADSVEDEALKKKAMEDGIVNYRKLIQLLNNKDSKGLNLELAYLLRKTGKLDEAKAIYSKFVKKYPNEFTYYLHFAKYYQEQKDFENARKMIDQAVKYSYGDNKIRCIDTQAKIMNDQGKRVEAIQTINQFLSEFKAPDASLKVRTRRHLDALKEYKEKLEKIKS